MKVKDLKIKLEFTDENGKHQELEVDHYDNVEFSSQAGYRMVMDMLGFVFPETNGQDRMMITAWRGMDKYEDLEQKDEL